MSRHLRRCSLNIFLFLVLVKSSPLTLPVSLGWKLLHGWLLLFLHVEGFQYLSGPYVLSVWMLEHTMLNEAGMFFCIFRLEPWQEPTAVLVIFKYSHNHMLKNVWAGSGSVMGTMEVKPSLEMLLQQQVGLNGYCRSLPTGTILF